MTEHDELLDLRKRADELLLSFISASGLQLIGDQAKLVEFDEGELICPKGMIPDHIHFMPQLHCNLDTWHVYRLCIQVHRLIRKVLAHFPCLQIIQIKL